MCFTEDYLDTHEYAGSLLSFIMNDKNLYLPVYVHGMSCEADGNLLGLYPLIYVWNENQDKGTYTVSINGRVVGHLLEGAVPREHSSFCAIRDEVMSALVQSASNSVASVCKASKKLPSDIFKSIVFEPEARNQEN